MVGRVLLLVAAVVVAGLGAVLVFLYAQQADDRALARFDPVSVVVVQGDVPAGTPVETAAGQGLLAVEQVPRAGVPARAVPSLADVAGLVVLSDLVAGEPLVRDRVGDPAQQERIVVPQGQLALSFGFADPNRVAGFVTPGSVVAVLLTYDGPAAGQAAVGAVPPGPVTRILLDQVGVLAVGTDSAAGVPAPDATGETVAETVLTLALTQEQAEAMVQAQAVGTLYLGLRGEATPLAPSQGVDGSNLFEVVGR